MSEMNEKQSKKYDLEERTFQFAKSVRSLVHKLPKISPFVEDVSQVIRASGSVGANYIEANEALSKKDSLMHLKISRKEAKECGYFLRLLSENIDNQLKVEVSQLQQESKEIRNILSSIILKLS